MDLRGGRSTAWARARRNVRVWSGGADAVLLWSAGARPVRRRARIIAIPVVVLTLPLPLLNAPMIELLERIGKVLLDLPV
jgi:hypothetical protein